jgi:hypothetical protein
VLTQDDAGKRALGGGAAGSYDDPKEKEEEEEEEEEEEDSGSSGGGSKALFFMPHCPRRLYSNLLWANWRPRALSSLAVAGNR